VPIVNNDERKRARLRRVPGFNRYKAGASGPTSKTPEVTTASRAVVARFEFSAHMHATALAAFPLAHNFHRLYPSSLVSFQSANNYAAVSQ
jgi:hypothetical protein